MAVTVYIPTSFRSLTDSRAFVDAEGADVVGVFRDLQHQFPNLGEVLFDADHNIPRASTSTSTLRRSRSSTGPRRPCRTETKSP